MLLQIVHHTSTTRPPALFGITSGGQVDLSNPTQDIIYAAGRLNGNQLRQHNVQGGSTLNVVQGRGLLFLDGPAGAPGPAAEAPEAAAAPAPTAAAPAPAPAAALVRDELVVLTACLMKTVCLSSVMVAVYAMHCPAAMF